MKKKTFLFPVLVLVLLASCTSPEIIHDTCTLTFKGNPTTGYEWTCSVPEDSVVELIGKDYIPDVKSDQVMISGSGGVYSFTFKAVREGLTEVLFSYGRQWDEEPARTQTYIMTVAEDMNISAREKEVQ